MEEQDGVRGTEAPTEVAAPTVADAKGAPPLEAPDVAPADPNTTGVPMSAFSAPPEQYWGIDLSYHRVTNQQAQDLWDAGVRVVFQCIWTGRERPAPAEDNIRSLAAHGFIVCAYLSVSAGRTGLLHVQEGFDTLDPTVQKMLVHVAVDHELEGYPVSVVRDAVDALRNRGFQPLIYTSYNAWYNILGNPPIPRDWSIWNAFWDNDSDFDFARYPYGGADPSQVIGEQFTGGEDVLGVNADRDLFQSWFFLPAPPQPEPEPTPDPTVEDLALATASWIHLARNGQLAALAAQDIAVIKGWAAKL